MMNKKLIFSSLVIGLWSTPTHSFTSPSLSKRASMIQRGAPAWKNQQHQQIASGSQDNIRGKRHSMLQSIPTSIIHNSLIPQNRTLAITTYFLLMNIIYILRRSHIRNMPKRKLLQIRLSREDGVKPTLYIINIMAWQLFVNFVFPLLELISRMFGHVSFYYFYPNAGGFGIIFEPLSAQSFSMSKRTKSQIRCDWHRFSVNIGDIGRDGFRHPPSVERNWPHFDIPRKGWKHWPWRRKHEVDRNRYPRKGT